MPAHRAAPASTPATKAAILSAELGVDQQRRMALVFDDKDLRSGMAPHHFGLRFGEKDPN